MTPKTPQWDPRTHARDIRGPPYGFQRAKNTSFGHSSASKLYLKRFLATCSGLQTHTNDSNNPSQRPIWMPKHITPVARNIDEKTIAISNTKHTHTHRYMQAKLPCEQSIHSYTALESKGWARAAKRENTGLTRVRLNENENTLARCNPPINLLCLRI